VNLFKERAISALRWSGGIERKEIEGHDFGTAWGASGEDQLKCSPVMDSLLNLEKEEMHVCREARNGELMKGDIVSKNQVAGGEGLGL